MIFSDVWTKGLKEKHQKLVVDYVMDGCKIKSGQGGYKRIAVIKSFIESPKGRKAIRAYRDFFFDKKKDIVKMQLVKMNMERAFYNPADIINAKGKLLDKYKNKLTNLNGKAYCIDGIELTHGAYGDSLKIKLADRVKAQEFIIRVFKIFEDEDKENFLDEKSVHDMTDEERNAEIKKLMDKQKLITKKGDKK